MVRLYSFLIGYAFGLFQTAFIVGKINGIDIRKYGSGNSGSTNALRVLGRKAGLTVFAGDMAKGIIAAVIVRFLFGETYGSLLHLLVMWCGVGCVLAHDFPFYMGFKGGKGIAATGGTIIAFSFLQPELLIFPLGLCYFFIPFFVTHYVSLGSLILYAGFFIHMLICGQLGLFGMPQAALYEMYGITFALMVLAYWQHRSNIVRLIKGTERKTFLGKKKPEIGGAEENKLGTPEDRKEENNG